MSPLKYSILAAALSAALTASALHVVQRRQKHEAQYLRDSNNELRLKAVMICRRATSLPLPAPNDAVPAASAGNLALEKLALPTATDYRNEGQATPVATLQTFAWACDRGDTSAIAKLLYFDKEARDKATAFIATLPEGVRAQWKSPEDMAATYFAAMQINSPHPDAAVLQTATVTPMAEDRVKLRLPGTLKDNSLYQKTGDTWQVVITERMVENYIQRVSSGEGG